MRLSCCVDVASIDGAQERGLTMADTQGYYLCPPRASSYNGLNPTSRFAQGLKGSGAQGLKLNPCTPQGQTSSLHRRAAAPWPGATPCLQPHCGPHRHLCASCTRRSSACPAWCSKRTAAGRRPACTWLVLVECNGLLPTLIEYTARTRRTNPDAPHSPSSSGPGGRAPWLLQCAPAADLALARPADASGAR
jgi:hypothetical protein